MKILSIIFLSLFGTVSAQTNRFLYELKFKSDSTSNYYDKDIMVLDINKNEVKYYDNVFLEKDSLNKKYNEQNTSWTSQIPVIRKIGSEKNTNYEMIDFQVYSYPTIDEIKWNLVDETKKYHDLNLQKATANFRGRKWTAWFTKDFPFPEGPYKFQGLPGLIVLLQDEKNQYNFSLIKNLKLPETYDTSNFLESRYGDKPLPITEKIFVKKKLEFYNDPFHEIRAKLDEGKTASFDYNGVRYRKSSELKPIVEQQREAIRKDNNPIELSKAIKYEK